MIFWTIMKNSPVGDILLVEQDGALRETQILQEKPDTGSIQSRLENLDPDVNKQDTPFLNLIEAQIREYFAGDRQTFDIKFQFEGTDFQNQVWKVIASTPFGSTISYGEIANTIGKPKASRAIGNACGKNPISIIIPCHRVLAADGKLGGYSSGLKNKRTLLALENIDYREN